MIIQNNDFLSENKSEYQEYEKLNAYQKKCLSATNYWRIISGLKEIKVPAEAYYAAQTQRSVENFPIQNHNPGHKMPKEVVRAMLLIKKAASLTNKDLMAADPKSDEFKKFSPDTKSTE